MALSDTRIYCQNCRAANALTDTHCINCGTRLLLVVFPNSLQYDTNQTPTFYEDHLLERVSILELRQAQLSDALRGAVEVLREQAEILREEKDLVRTLFRLISDSGGAGTAETAALPSDRLRETGTYERIVEAHDGGQGEMFGKLVRDAFAKFDEAKEKQALRLVERAGLVSIRNFPLRLETARRLFFAELYQGAEKWITEALELEPHSVPALFLSGIIEADSGRPDEARKRLGLLVSDSRTGGFVNFVWGMLAAYEGKWTESIAALKQSDPGLSGSETNYLIGSAYFQLGRYPMAIRHLRLATRSEKGFSDAWFMQSVVCGLAGDTESSQKAIENAAAGGEPSPQCAEFLRDLKPGELRTAIAFRHFEKENARVLTGGSRRIAAFVRESVRRIIEELD